jgi:hypothetical protein
MFAVVLQQEHNKLAAKTPKKAKNTKIIMDESSSDMTAKTKTCLLTKCQSAKRTKPTVRPKN